MRHKRNRWWTLVDRVAGTGMLLVAGSFVLTAIFAARFPSRFSPKSIGFAIALGIIGVLVLAIALIDDLRQRRARSKTE